MFGGPPTSTGTSSRGTQALEPQCRCICEGPVCTAREDYCVLVFCRKCFLTKPNLGNDENSLSLMTEAADAPFEAPIRDACRLTV